MESPTQRTLLLDAVVLFTVLLDKGVILSEFDRNSIETWMKLAEEVLYPKAN
jgi:hypothetical protein